MNKRNRESSKDLLPLMEARRWIDGKTITYRYHPIGKKPINLGKDRINAIRKVLDLIGGNKNMGTLRWVWDRYTDPETPSIRWKSYAEKTKKDYTQAWAEIEKTFGDMQADQINSIMVSRYVHIERAAASKRANTEKSLLSVLFGYGIQLGVCTLNPTIGVTSHPREPRFEVPKEDLLAGYLDWLSRQSPQRQIIGLAAEYASLAGSRKCEFLNLTWPQIDRQEGVIKTIRGKQRGWRRDQIIDVVKISPAMSNLLDKLAAKRKVDCLYVFPTQSNNPYSDSGFKGLWQRCVIDAINQNVLTKETRFTFHDLRAFYATKHKKDRGALPDLHANPATTSRVYDRNTEVIRTSN